MKRLFSMAKSRSISNFINKDYIVAIDALKKTQPKMLREVNKAYTRFRLFPKIMSLLTTGDKECSLVIVNSFFNGLVQLLSTNK
jgi:hypothetical protein